MAVIRPLPKHIPILIDRYPPQYADLLIEWGCAALRLGRDEGFVVAMSLFTDIMEVRKVAEEHGIHIYTLNHYEVMVSDLPSAVLLSLRFD